MNHNPVKEGNLFLAKLRTITFLFDLLYTDISWENSYEFLGRLVTYHMN